jgi:hypothetical protein
VQEWARDGAEGVDEDVVDTLESKLVINRVLAGNVVLTMSKMRPAAYPKIEFMMGKQLG